MFSKILIANRGEIALRIIRSAQELGIKTVAVFSEPDRESLHTLVADEKVCIGPRKASESYLNIPRIMSAAEITKADAIHPGYGFLAENPRFPEICENSGITFIGPPSSVIKLMGDKNRARQEMKKAKLPVIPGSDTIIESILEAKKVVKKIGYPVILKAVAGGGGKGMRIAHSAADLEKQFLIAQNEAKAAFGNPSLYMERYIKISRHIEIQVIGDNSKNVSVFAERECSVQRKHQKLVEETPSPFIDEKTRKRMMKAAQDAAKAIGYKSLGTFEFLVDERKRFYFMEANARIQVEHPITEMVYGIDLVKEQIKIAAGGKLILPPDMKPRGHSLECRINAEEAETFIPSPGKIDFLVLPGGQGVRVDSAAYRGWVIPPDYDSLLAKIIVHSSNRKESIKKMQMALESTSIGGINTNIPLHLKILANSDFQSGNLSTQFMDKFLADKKNEKE
ncbi:acetyl-CoA carboxylase biotin carboxylase subunit [Acidobacteriota bacterium]